MVGIDLFLRVGECVEKIVFFFFGVSCKRKSPCCIYTVTMWIKKQQSDFSCEEKFDKKKGNANHQTASEKCEEIKLKKINQKRKKIVKKN